MADYEDILKRLKGLNPSVVPCIPAIVKSVESVTCTVVLLDGLELSGVRLKAGVDTSEDFIRIKPRPKSSVLIAQIGSDETAGEYYVAAYNEVDELTMKINDTLVIVNKDKVSAEVKDASCELTKDNTIVKVGKVGDSQSKITVSKTAIILEPHSFISVKNQQASLSTILQNLVNELKNLRVVFAPPTAYAGPYPVTGYANIDPAATARLQIELDKIINLLN